MGVQVSMVSDHHDEPSAGEERTWRGIMGIVFLVEEPRVLPDVTIFTDNSCFNKR